MTDKTKLLGHVLVVFHFISLIDFVVNLIECHKHTFLGLFFFDSCVDRFFVSMLYSYFF